MKKKKNWWIWLIVIGYIGLIFYNSLMNSTASSTLSTRVAYRLLGILEHFGLTAQFSVFHHYVRKLAHFTEFFGLGFLVSLAICVCPLFRSRTANFLLFLTAVPFADETIQRFIPGRTSAFTDMLIDCSGVLAGGLAGYILILIIRDLSAHHQNRSAA